MSAVTIDELQIRVNGTSTNAYAAVDALVGALEKLQDIRIDGGIAQAIDGIGKAASRATSKVSKMSGEFAKGMANANKYAMVLKNFSWEFGKRQFMNNGEQVFEPLQIGMEGFQSPLAGDIIDGGIYTEIVDEAQKASDETMMIWRHNAEVIEGLTSFERKQGIKDAFEAFSNMDMRSYNPFESMREDASKEMDAIMTIWRHNAEVMDGLSQNERAQGIKDAMAAFTDADWSKYNPSYAFFNSIENGFEHLKQKATEATKSMGTFFKSIQRIAMYRAIRSALKMIASGLKEGVQNLAQYSKAIGEADTWAANSVMSEYATKFLEVKNAVGSAAMPILAALQPVVISVANAFIYATNALNMFFSALGGKGTYTKAQSAAVDYAATLDKSSAGASKAAKELSAGFDELNVINDNSGGGGGGGSSNGMPAFTDMFGEEVIPQGLINNLELIKNLAIAIGLAFAAWKIASLFTSDLGKIAGLALAAAGAFLLLKGAIDGWINGVNWSNAIEMIGGTALLAGGLALAFGHVGAAIGLLVGGVAMLVVGIKDWITTGELSTETMWLMVAGIMAIGGGLALLLGPAGWIPLVIAAVIALGLIVYKYWDEIKTFCINVWTAVSEFFKGVWEDIKLGVETTWNSISDFFTVTIPTIINNIVTWFFELPGKIAYAIGFVLGALFAWEQNVSKWIIEEVPKLISKIVEFFAGLPEKIKEAVNKVKDTIVNWATDAIGWVKENVPKIINEVVDWFAKLPEALVNVGKNMVKAMWNGIVSMGTWLWDKITGFLGDLGEFASDILGNLGQGIEEGYDAVPHYASGGIVGSGQMFIARESGAELVGNIGGSTAVMNNDQIVSAVSVGVYDAVVSAMAQSNSRPQSVQVFLNGKQIEASTRETKQRRGATIASGGIYNFA